MTRMKRMFAFPAALGLAATLGISAPVDAQQRTQPQAEQQRKDMKKEYKKDKEMSAEKFIQEASVGNMLEVRVGEIARERATNEQARQLADRLVRDHGQAQDNLEQVAQQLNIEVPQRLDQKAQQMVDKLSQTQPNQFDQQFVQMALDDHRKDLQKYSKAITQLDNADLQRYAAETLSVLGEHYVFASEAKKSLQTQPRGGA